MADLKILCVALIVVLLIALVLAIIRKAIVLIIFLILLGLVVPPLYTVAFGDGTEIVAAVASYMPDDIAHTMIDSYAYYQRKNAENHLLGANRSDDVLGGFSDYGKDKFPSAFGDIE